MVSIFLSLLLITGFSTTIARQSSNISLGSSLSPNAKRYWLSDSGQFAFGFYEKDDGFAIGIWLENIKQKTVVWTANRDDSTLSRNATLLLTYNGRLVLEPKQGQQTALTDAQYSASSASMLDTGNFVLFNSTSTIIWQTFDAPTDTILSGQSLLAGKKLVSGSSETNHSSGKFQLIMQTDGNLVQYPTDFPPKVDGYAYWHSHTVGAGNNVSLNLDRNGQLFLLNSIGFNIKNLYDPGKTSHNFSLYRLTLDFDGILRLYSHSLNQDDDDWSFEWTPSSSSCDPIGLCGQNAYCIVQEQKAICNCPPGFDFLDRGQHNLGCKINSSTVGCTSKNGKRVDYVQDLEGVEWKDKPYSNFSLSKIECRDNCSKDCECGAALFKDQQCRKQKFPLRFGTGQQGNSVTTIIKVRFGSPNTTQVSKGRKKQVGMGILIGSSVILAFALCILTLTGILIYKCRLWEYKKIKNQGNDGLIEVVSLRSYTYGELEKATNGFTNEVGKGAFGTVFKGVIDNGKTVVAVKRLETVVAESEREFRNEMKAIGRTHHKNLVKLLGYCHDGTNRLLVYEYMSNGSLADFLFKSRIKPSWEEKTRIALNVARGILYLHDECENSIIHCDIKPENILMDEQKSTKIADFGLAKLLMPNQTRTYTGMRGTRGYVAPEWHRNLPITLKADVYSFGIVLLEIICGRRNVNVDLPEEEVVLANWVFDCFEAHELDRLVKDEQVELNKLERMVKVGLWCIQEEPSFRPTMKRVVLMLEGTVEIPAPPGPTPFSSAM